MDKPKATPKDFFLWAGAMLALWGGVIAFITLIFDYINYTFPDILQQYVQNPYQGGMPYEMASLIVLTPVFLGLMRFIRRDIARDPSRNEVWVRHWALFLTLFAAGITIVVDLIVLIMTFLSGEELSVRFLLKVVVVLLVAAAGFMHFIADLWGYWLKYPARARYINWGVGVLVVAAIVAGFFIVGTPQQARQMRLDDQRVSDLSSIQSYMVYNYYQSKRMIPAALADLNDPISGYIVPVDPETAQPYEYKVVGPLTFELCATFAAPTGAANGQTVARPTSPYGGVSDTWQHGAGRTCFTRTIDPQLYPSPVPTPKGL